MPSYYRRKRKNARALKKRRVALIAALAVPVGWLQYGGEAGALLLLSAGIMLARHWPGLVRMYRGEEPQFFRPKH